MSRPLDELRPDDTAAPASERRVARSTGRAFAAAISALLISTLVITRSSTALESEGTVASSSVSAGVIALEDDDRGESLFDLTDMGPGRPVERCIVVVYEGTILPVDLALSATADGPLAPYLDTTVEAGEGGGFGSCEGFVAATSLYEGTMRGLADDGAIVVDTFYNQGESRTFRVTITLADEQDALGLTATTGFLWEVTPS